MTGTERSPFLLLLVLAIVHCADTLAQALVPPQALQRQYEFSIERMRLTAALHKFSEQSGLNMGFFPETDAEEAQLVGPLKGVFTTDEALAALLGPIGYRHEWLNHRSLYAFRPGQAVSEVAPPPQELQPSSKRIRPVESRAPVIVIASRIHDIEAPSVELHRETIDSYGASTLAEVFRYLPQIPFINSPDARLTGEQYVDLRGFGAGTTVVLVNGRRLAATATSLESSGFDMNTLPLAAIKKIEVMLDPPIAYGADALGGAINIVLQDEVPEPVVQARFGSAQGGAEEAQASLTFGLTRDRLRGAASLDVFHREFLLGDKRDQTSNQDFRRFGGPDARSLESSPPNISSLSGMNLPGLAFSYAAVPEGGSNLAIADFEMTQGQRNLVSSNAWRSIVPRSTKISALGSAELSLTDEIALFGEFQAIERNHVMQIGPPTIRNAVVPASNPWNPFDEAVLVSSMVEGVGSTKYLADTSLLRGVLGVRASLDEWSVAASSSMHQEKARLWSENTIDYAKLVQALGASDPNDALNVFRDGPAGSPSLLRSLIVNRDADSFESQLVDVQLRAKGPVAELPAGKVVLHLGGDWTRRTLSAPAALSGSKHSTNSAAFGELGVPLVAPDMKLPAMQLLSLSVGLRIDDGNREEEHVSTEYALNWHPIAAASIRASYRELWRSPNLYDLYQPRFVDPPVPFPDPKRGNEITNFVIVGGGNQSLSPSSGRAWSVRLEVEPIDRATISIGYWHSVILNRILYQPIPFFLDHESTYSDRVVRAAPTPQDIQHGLPGVIQSVDVSAGNFGALDASGIDFTFQGSWDTEFGRFSPRVTAVWNQSFRTIDGPGLIPDQRVGVASPLGTIPRWRAVASLHCERGPWALFSALRFVGDYDDSFLGTKIDRSIPASYQVDVQASAKLDAYTKFALLQGMVARIGATNLTNEEPAYSQVFGSLGYDIGQADLRQRFWYLMLERRF